jgi:hypothetical protein
MSAYGADQKAAAKLLSLIADGEDDVTAGRATKTTSSTTLVVTHGLTSTPDFILVTLHTTADQILAPLITANTTSVTITINTAQATWSADYIFGYTA